MNTFEEVYNMQTLYFILLLAGFICLLLAALGVNVRRVALMPLGLALWIAVPMIMAFKGM